MNRQRSSSKTHHADWLSLVEVSGPFVSTPVMDRVFPQGLDAHDPEHSASLRLAYEEWDDDQSGERPTTAIHNAWIKFILTETLGFTDEVLAEGQAVPAAIKATIAEHNETLRPDFVVRNPAGVADEGKARLLIQTYPVDQSLDKPIAGRHWKASPATRMMELLHATDVRLGLVTNGQQWMLVDAPRGETTGFASWYAWLWFEQSDKVYSYFRSFRSLLCARRLFSVADAETLEAILAESATHQQEVTDQLGLQVRRAVEVLIQSLDRADQDDKVLAGVPETVLYEAALTVMMRLVFLFSAEERGLLLLGDPLYDEHYAVSTLVAQLQEAADQHGEEVLERRNDAWVRLLATFRAVFGGVQHERMKLLAYSGNLFDPDRFPFLEGRKAGTSWTGAPATPLPVNNRTVLHLLRSLQYLEFRGEARRLSFIALDIEQIGHVYEGLLDHTAKRATEPMLGLLGAKGLEPEVPLSELERQRTKSEDDLIEYVAEESGRSEKAIRKALTVELDKDQAAKLLKACGHNDGVFCRVQPFAGLIRNDTFDQPVIIRKGSVFVTAGTDRRASGTHYTPRSLTEPIVQYTLEPLVYVGPGESKPNEEWRLRSAKELLNLKICDMACGSGAFLVQTCRYLSERLVEAWEDAENQHPGVPGITPDGRASTGAPGETLIPKEMDERIIYARRLIAQRCLYGVDKNPLAAEMAKLSLWLLTLAKDKPFTFLDHSIRTGDSIVGIKSLDQIKHFNLNPQKTDRSLFTGPVLQLVDEAVELRMRLESAPVNTVEDVQMKARLLAEAEDKTARLRYAADLLISVEFSHSDTGDDKEDIHNHRAIQAGHYVEDTTLDEFREVARNALNGQTTFHWPLEFPEVVIDRGGFDAFVSNPPFLGGKRISTVFGRDYEAFLKHAFTSKKGHADLCVYFYLRAFFMLRETGCFGLLATNTIAQTDTREIGLETISESGSIFRAYPSMSWPGTAGVVVALVFVCKGSWKGLCFLNKEKVSSINSHLHQGAPERKPMKLVLNKQHFFGTKGTCLYGKGFIITAEKKSELVAKRSDYAPLIQPYLIAKDFTTNPRQHPSRFVINFGDMSESDAREYDALFEHVVNHVKPERDALRGQIHEKCFWKFWDKREELYEKFPPLNGVIVCPEVSKYSLFAIVSKDAIFGHVVNVIANERLDLFAVLQSSFHAAWAWKHGSTMKTDLRYSTSDCLDTYPFPEQLIAGREPTIEDVGQRYHQHRQQLMVLRQEGLTKTYNRFHARTQSDADIQELRSLHIEMDTVVARAYGWDRIKLAHGFHETKQGIRFTISESARHEILQCLLKLNHERYTEEVKKGLHEKKSSRKSTAKKRASKKAPVKQEETLFD